MTDASGVHYSACLVSRPEKVEPLTLLNSMHWKNSTSQVKMSRDLKVGASVAAERDDPSNAAVEWKAAVEGKVEVPEELEVWAAEKHL